MLFVMLNIVANVLKEQLSGLDWIERLGGLVAPATRHKTAQATTGQHVITGTEVWPVAYEVDTANCFETGVYRYFEPDGSKAAVAFFKDVSGAIFDQVEGPKRSHLRYRFTLHFLCWLNMQRLGNGITGQTFGFASGRLAPYVISNLWGQHEVTPTYDADSVEAKAVKWVEVTAISELQKTSRIFEPFTFAQDGEKRGLFLYPYDYFGLAVTGYFTVNANCLSDLYTPPFAPETDTCIRTVND